MTVLISQYIQIPAMEAIDNNGNMQFTFPLVDFTGYTVGGTTISNILSVSASFANFHIVFGGPGYQNTSLWKMDYGLSTEILPKSSGFLGVKLRGWIKYTGNSIYTEVLNQVNLSLSGVDINVIGIAE